MEQYVRGARQGECSRGSDPKTPVVECFKGTLTSPS